jgi:hypothetical protein
MRNNPKDIYKIKEIIGYCDDILKSYEKYGKSFELFESEKIFQYAVNFLHISNWRDLQLSFSGIYGFLRRNSL